MTFDVVIFLSVVRINNITFNSGFTLTLNPSIGRQNLIPADEVVKFHYRILKLLQLFFFDMIVIHFLNIFIVRVI